MSEGKTVYIVDGLRTPFLKSRGKPGPFAAADLAVMAGRMLLQRLPIDAEQIGEVILGCNIPSPDEANIARIVALRLGCGNNVPAFTVQRNCASGMQSIDSGFKDIQAGRHELVLCGGTEAMSHAPLLFNHDFMNWAATLQRAKTPLAKAKAMARVKPRYFKPIIALVNGLTDPVVSLNMGQTAEILAAKFNITREAMDTFSMQSHLRAAKAYEQGLMEEVIAIYDEKGTLFNQDDGIRADSTLEKLMSLKPFFAPNVGLITAGNSSQITDGAAMMLLASKEAVKQYNLPVLGKIVETAWGALNPREMGLGPVHASTPLLLKQGLGLNDIDYWEINEAFGAQVLACLAAWQDKDYCQTHLGLDNALGQLDQNTLNVDGGAIALGHPVGTSGTRIVLHLLHVLARNHAKRGVASLCIGGGQGGAMLLERE